MRRHVDPRWRGVWGGSLLLCSCLSVEPLFAEGQTAARASWVQSVSGAITQLEDAAGAQSAQAPSLTVQTVLDGQVVQLRPRLTLGALGQVSVALNPDLGESDSTSGTAGSQGSAYTLRIQPQLGLFGSAAVSERLRVQTFARLQAHWNASENGDALSEGTDPSGTDPSGTDPSGTDPGSDWSSSLETLLDASLLRQLTRLPQDLWWGEVGLALDPSFGGPWSGGMSLSQRWQRPFVCGTEQSALDPALALTARPVKQDALNLQGELGYAASEVRRFSGRLAGRFETSSPLEGCLGSESVEARRFYLLTPGVSGSWGASAFQLGLGLGLTAGVEQVVGEALTAQPELRPVFSAQVDRRWGVGRLEASVRNEVLSLPGQAVPTYNFLVEGGGAFEPGSIWSVRGQLSALRVFPLWQDTAAPDGMRALTGRAEVLWTPRYWVRLAAGWSLTRRKTMPSSSLEVDADFERVWLQAFFLHLTLTADPG
ncbi:MAG: hypothetical protein ACKO6N_10495 [Myxococcota bacterium]